MNDKQNEKKEKAVPQTGQRTVSERFTALIINEFSGTVGKLEMSAYQKRLAQHLFIKIDTSLKELEKKRIENSKDALPLLWANINMEKLAIDAIHRIELGLDALIPNHISPIPYWNNRLKKYDLDLRIGYAGKDYYHRQMALDPPEDIIYELVYKNDLFKPIKASSKNPTESYEFEVPKPFDRGEVVGGFAYIVYKDSKKNKLIIVTEKDFLSSKAKAQAKEFWEGHPEAMRFKTIVNRATSKLQIDPEKVNASFTFVEQQEDIDDAMEVQSNIEEKANKGEIITTPDEPFIPDNEAKPEKTTPPSSAESPKTKEEDKRGQKQQRSPGF